VVRHWSRPRARISRGWSHRSQFVLVLSPRRHSEYTACFSSPVASLPESIKITKISGTLTIARIGASLTTATTPPHPPPPPPKKNMTWADVLNSEGRIPCGCAMASESNVQIIAARSMWQTPPCDSPRVAATFDSRPYQFGQRFIASSGVHLTASRGGGIQKLLVRIVDTNPSLFYDGRASLHTRKRIPDLGKIPPPHPQNADGQANEKRFLTRQWPSGVGFRLVAGWKGDRRLTIFDSSGRIRIGAVISIDPDTGAPRDDPGPYTELSNVSWLADGKSLGSLIYSSWKQLQPAAGWLSVIYGLESFVQFCGHE